MTSIEDLQKKRLEYGRIIRIERMNVLMGLYNLFPNVCKSCGCDLPYYKKDNVFCSHGCKGKNMETNNPKQKKIKYCCTCNKILSKNRVSCCSHECSYIHSYEKKAEEGNISERSLKKLLIYTNGRECMSCHNTLWLGEEITLELHHKDGNAINNHIENGEILCPNCHSQTDNFKAKNKKCTRKDRYLK